MIVTIKTQGLQTMEQIRALLGSTLPLGFEAPAREALYQDNRDRGGQHS